MATQTITMTEWANGLGFARRGLLVGLQALHGHADGFRDRYVPMIDMDTGALMP